MTREPSPEYRAFEGSGGPSYLSPTQGEDRRVRAHTFDIDGDTYELIVDGAPFLLHDPTEVVRKGDILVLRERATIETEAVYLEHPEQIPALLVEARTVVRLQPGLARGYVLVGLWILRVRTDEGWERQLGQA